MDNRRSGQLGLGDAYKKKTGEVLALEDIDGVGETLAKRIAAATGTRNPKEVAEYSPGQLSDKVTGVSRQMAQRIVNRGGGSKHTSKGGGGTNVLNTQTTAAMRTMAVGDFQVDLAKQDSAEAKHDFRSQTARRTDRNERAPITTDLGKWKENKATYDFPGVDTPGDTPDVLPKDFTRGGPFETSEQASESATERKPAGPSMWPEGENPAQHTGASFAGELDTGLAPKDYEDEIFTPGDRNRRKKELADKPPETALTFREGKEKDTLATQKTAGSDVAFIYENADLDITLDQFRQRTSRKKRKMSGLADDFAAAGMVADDFELE